VVVDQLRYSTDGTLEGLLTALYIAFTEQQEPDNILVAEDLQAALFNSDIPIITNIEQATAMQQRIIKSIGEPGYEDIKKLYLADDMTRGGVAYRYLRCTLPRGSKSRNDLANPAVADAELIIRQVQREAHYMQMFVRFADVGGGLFYSHITPKASVVPLIMNHFAARYNVQPFVIHDSRHALSGVFDTKRWWLTDGLPQSISQTTVDEDKFQQLWQRFFKTIAIPERRNPVVQRGFMPKRFWGDMCEQRLPYTRRADELK
jgi:probable DNA metabolism protein